VQIVLGQMVGHARQARVHIAAAQVFGAHHLAGGGFHQRRATEEDGALVAHDDGLVAHRGHVGATRRARAHHHRNLRDRRPAQIGLVVEDAAEMLAIREHLVLVGQVGAAGVDQVDAGQPVLRRDLLRAQVLLHREREVRAAFHRGVVAHDHAFHAADAANTRNQAGAGRGVGAVLFLVDVQRGQRTDLEKGRVGVKQALDPVARQQLAACRMLGARLVRPAACDARQLRVEVVDERAHRGRVGLEFLGARIELARQLCHYIVSANNSLPISMRRISEVPAPIS
jgi:hypothetical protein